MSERDEIERVIEQMRQRAREFAGQVGDCQCETSWHSHEIDGWADELSALLQRHAGEPEGWQPIATAPKDGDLLLLYSERDGVRAGYWDDNAMLWVSEASQYFTACRTSPTHWMPLPSPPKDSGDLPTPDTNKQKGLQDA